MASVNETVQEGQFAPSLLAGLRTLSEDQVVPFGSYIRYVLPIDGYVYWLRTRTEPVKGSLHVTAEKRQEEDETIAVNRIVFTTGENVGFFNATEPEQLWVGEAAGVRFAFSRSGPRYRQAGLWHYFGFAVYPALETQLVDIGSQLDQRTLVVSNSLPAWLSLHGYDPEWLPVRNPGVILYPSYLVPVNAVPPYGSVHVMPEHTRAVNAFPSFGRRTSSQRQFVTERVRVTLYGLDNDQAFAFEALVNQFSEDTNLIGLTDVVAVRDDHRTQPELGVIAMKKTLEYGVCYEQGAIRDTARALVRQAKATVIVQSYTSA